MRLRKILLAKWVTLTGILVGASATQPSTSQRERPTPLEISVDTSRPIAAALDVLERRHGAVITYEDPRYAHETDLADVTADVRKDGGGNHEGTPARVLVPKAGRLHVSYVMRGKPNQLNDIAVVIRLLLEAHAEQVLPGTFRLDQTDKHFHVVPIAVKGEDGILVEAGSVLDAKIDITEGERTGIEALEAICAALRHATGEHVTPGMAPVGLLAERTVSIGASHETARGVLVRALRDTEHRMSWRLFYDPGLKWHLLNVHVVPERDQGITSSGKKRR